MSVRSATAAVVIVAILLLATTAFSKMDRPFCGGPCRPGIPYSCGDEGCHCNGDKHICENSFVSASSTSTDGGVKEPSLAEFLRVMEKGSALYCGGPCRPGVPGSCGTTCKCNPERHVCEYKTAPPSEKN